MVRAELKVGDFYVRPHEEELCVCTSGGPFSGGMYIDFNTEKRRHTNVWSREIVQRVILKRKTE